MPGLTTKTIDQHHILTEPLPRPEPGKVSYSNTNFTFLGLITEAITGEPAESQMRKRILEPLNLTKTYVEGFEPNPFPLINLVPDRYHWANPEFEKTAGICPEFNKPETRQDLINASKSNTSVEWTAGGYISHPSDLCKLALAIRSCDPRIISPASQELMYQFRDVPGARTPLQVGHGIFRTNRQEGVFLGHNGSVLGFAGMMFWSEEEDVAISVLGNVGTMHAGVVANAADVGLGKEFLESVMKLARVKSAKN
jgi:D-alanyl-D-alanine carboxypeptidase